MKTALKKIYSLIPYKKQLYTILRLLPIPENIFKHLFFEGWITVRVKNSSFRIYHYGYQLENELFWRGISGGWERVSMRLWTELSAISNSIIDIGANTGVYALVSKAINPKARVTAFEPVRRVFERLVRNSEINQFNIITVDKGLSNFVGPATIYDLNSDHIYSVTINQNTNPSGMQVIPTTIDVTTLDAHCEQSEIMQIDLIKIDVETHEPEVLEGALGVIKRDRPAIIIEILNHEAGLRVNKILDKFDYMYFALNEKSGPQVCQKIGEEYFGNYLACHKHQAEFLKLI